MSSRALRRLEREKEGEILGQKKPADVDEYNSSADEIFQSVQQKKVNAFAFLGSESEESEIEVEQEIDDSITSEEYESATEGEGYVRPEPKKVIEEKVTLPSKKLKKKNKKKGKKQSTATTNKQTKQTVDSLDDDELDKLLAQARHQDGGRLVDTSLTDGPDLIEDGEEDVIEDNGLPLEVYTLGGKNLTTAKFKSALPLLQFNPKDLDPDQEFSNLFGKLSTAAIDDADSTSSTFITPEVLKQIKLMSKRVRGWSGRDRRGVPGTARRLTMTKIRDDWIPTQYRPLTMDELSTDDIFEHFTEKYPSDWKDVIKSDIRSDYATGIRYFEVTPSNAVSARETTTQFYISVVVQPDHEALISLLQRNPYHLETILQVTNILQRQGDNSNSNGLIERAIFVFDWCLKNTFGLGDGLSRLPFEFYLNRQIYLTLFRYIGVLTQKSTFYTALNYCKLLLSFEPADDPFGVRYFIDFYAILSSEYQYLIDFANSKLVTCYKEWFTAPLAYSVVLCHFKLGDLKAARDALKLAFEVHPYTGYMILDKLNNGASPQWRSGKVSSSVELSTAIYLVRVKLIYEEQDAKSFLTENLHSLITSSPKIKEIGALQTVTEIPHNLIRHVILSGETSAMAKIPPKFWEKNEIFEFDILPPAIGSTIHEYIDENRVGDAMISQSFDSEQERQLAEILRQTALDANRNAGNNG